VRPFDLVVGDAQTTNSGFHRIAGALPEAALILLTAPPRHGKEEIWPDGVDAIPDKAGTRGSIRPYGEESFDQFPNADLCVAGR